MAQRHAEGLCYNFDEKFALGHRCKELFIIEIAGTGEHNDDKAADEEVECAPITVALDVPSISLHAITGVRARAFQTMRVYVSVGDAVGVALLDSGSFHNFIDTDMAHRASLHLQPDWGLPVVVANGNRMSSSRKLKD